jgi:hypothetical protein
MATTYEMMLQMLGGVNPKSVNTMQDLSSYLFNPQYGITGNTFDPSYTLPAPYVPNTPRLDAYANSTNPLWRDTAMGIMNGSLDEASAVAALYNGLGFDYETEVKQGLSLDGIRSAVKEMFDEKERDVAARIKYDQDLLESEAGNIFGKAGLPQPYEEWTAETMPVSDPLRSFFSRLQTMENELGQKKKDIGGAEQLARLRLLAKRSASGGGSADTSVFVPQSEEQAKQLAKQIGVDEGWLAGMYKEISNGSWVYDDKKEKYVWKKPTVDEMRDIWQTRMKNEMKEAGAAVYDFGQDDLEARRAEKVLGTTTDKVNIPESDEAKRENARFLNRAVQESVQPKRDEYAQLERKLLQNKAVAANKLLGEKIALGIQGRTPLEEALRRRALGLQGM